MAYIPLEGILQDIENLIEEKLDNIEINCDDCDNSNIQQDVQELSDKIDNIECNNITNITNNITQEKIIKKYIPVIKEKIKVKKIKEVVYYNNNKNKQPILKCVKKPQPEYIKMYDNPDVNPEFLEWMNNRPNTKQEMIKYYEKMPKMFGN